jgi:CheY-like chemotaxis protein
VSSDSQDDLRDAFAEELHARVRTLDGQLEALSSGGAADGLAGPARAEAHRLRGSALTLRLDALAAAAAEAEELLAEPVPDALRVRAARTRLAGAARTIDGTALDLPDAAPVRAERALPRTVLQIEDGLPNATLVERFLARAAPSVTVVTTASGEEGVELARRSPPDVVLLDLGLTDVDGRDVLRRLRGDPATAAVPVVVVSADATPGEIERLREAGAREYLTKPLDLDRLLATLELIAAEQP